MNYCIIDNKSYDVIVSEIEEAFTVLYGDSTGRTLGEGAPMILDPLGTFFNYKVTFARKQGKEQEYDELFDFLAKPRSEGIEVNIVHNQALWQGPFKAYVSQGARALKRIDKQTGKVYWDKFTANIFPMKAQVLPDEE